MSHTWQAVKAAIDALERPPWSADPLVSKRLDLQLSGVEKFVASGTRHVRGFASTDSVDRVGDIVDPKGGKWKTPLPMLWQHKHDVPIGWIRSVEVRGRGLWIEAEFAEGIGQADEVWRMVEAGLVTGFSIGFMGRSWEPLPSGGRRYTDWELYEVSAVVIPANPDASIQRSLGAVRLISPPRAGAVLLIDHPDYERNKQQRITHV
ncbi:HK97 family phage prohead protease [Hydrogenophaga sp. BPS33]|uniref:HK97 family phage prohead protease n=1 Tax=Hydrogenophaga sp. BPS33 TaxID=2651974 RepID=UPI00131FA794|nr:HK97 family phage prohead protease [Hydrogenophaga sp. BPS33]QHE86515.1 HK97 family phage prohead protease [Hydrogenophaga sp. BPS33]